ncbi:hypothetical protein BHQ20_26580 [Mycobacterium intermedium]|nr:hypothetical protein BHQ20_26580 [Mycobacterium intermedium]
MTDLEGDPRSVGPAQVDRQAIADVDRAHSNAVDENSARGGVVDRDPAVLIEAQQQVSAGDERVCDAHIGVHVTADDNVATSGEGSLNLAGANGQHRMVALTHYSSLPAPGGQEGA